MREEHDVLGSDWVYDMDPDKNFGEEGTIKMDRADMQTSLDMFYRPLVGTFKRGAPTRATPDKFSLGFVADKLAARGLLPA